MSNTSKTIVAYITLIFILGFTISTTINIINANNKSFTNTANQVLDQDYSLSSQNTVYSLVPSTASSSTNSISANSYSSSFRYVSPQQNNYPPQRYNTTGAS